MALTDTQIACIVHAAQREYCRIIGEGDGVDWDALTTEQQNSIITTVTALRTSTAPPTAELHEVWRAQMAAQGWAVAGTYNLEAKLSPAMVDYANLSLEHKRKYQVLRGAVLGCFDGI